MSPAPTHPADPAAADLIADLKWRGLLHQCTDEAALRKHLSTPRKVYVGFDPTAPSLTVGNLMGIVMLRRFQMAGHTPVVVMGGATGMVGDPSGKNAERTLLTLDKVAENVKSQQPIFRAILDFDGPHGAKVANNADWLGKLSYIEVLRDIGKHFSVNEMIKRDSVRDRLQREHGISYTEFSYMLLQAYDYFYLFRHHEVTLQMGGSDQWGNILSGMVLTARMSAIEDVDEWERENPELRDQMYAEAKRVGIASFVPTDWMSQHGFRIKERMLFGLTWPLVAKADGTKFGKSESGAVWLTADYTSPYGYYQFWLNASDADVVKFLKFFTLLPHSRIDALAAAHAADPGKREAHRELARHMTAMLHGEAELQHAEAAANALFSGDVAVLPRKILDEVFASVPSSDHHKQELQGDGLLIVDLLAQTSLAKSKREAREHLGAGAVTVNGEKAGPDDRLTPARLLHGELALFRRGKKAWHVTRWR